MAPKARVSYADFKQHVKNALDDTRRKALKDRPVDRLETEHAYRALVADTATEYRKEHLKRRDISIEEEWRNWITLTRNDFGNDWDVVKTLTPAKIVDLRKAGGSDIEYAFALHFRLHGEFALTKYAKLIDLPVFGDGFEDVFYEPVFIEAPNCALAPSFPRGIRLNSTHQYGRDEFSKVKSALLSEEGPSVGLSTAILGAGGYGKTAVAEEICLDDEVREAFGGGIYWLQFGIAQGSEDQRESRAHKLRDAIGAMLEKQYGTSAKQELELFDDDVASQTLFANLPLSPILIVADDLWSEAQARWIAELPDHVTALVTTRTRSLRPLFNEPFQIEPLQKEMSYDLLNSGLIGLSKDQSHRLRQIAPAFRGWPLLLRLANATFKTRQENGTPIGKILTNLDEFTKYAAISGWDVVDPGGTANESRRKLVKYCVDAGLAALPNETFYTALRSMSVFPEDTDIPFSVVADFWKEMTMDGDGQGRIGAEKASTILDALHNLSFFRHYDPENETLRVHDEFLAYFRETYRASEIEGLHEHLVNSIKQHCPLGWQTLSGSHHYSWKHLLYHMEQGGLYHVADECRTNLGWLKGKLKAVGFRELQHSFISKRLSKASKLVNRALNMSAFNIQTQPSSLALQLFGRLGHNSEELPLENLVADTTSDSDFSPRPRWPHLKPLGAELFKLEGHTKLIKSVKFSPSFDLLATASLDGTVRIWSTETGEQISTIPIEDSDGISAMSFNNTGSALVIGSMSGAAHVWNLSCQDFVMSNIKCSERSLIFVSFGPSEQQIIVGSTFDGVSLWDIEIGNKIDNLLDYKGQLVSSVAFDPSQGKMVTASPTDRSRIFDYNSGDQVALVAPHKREYYVSEACFSLDGKLIAACTFGGEIGIFDATSGCELATIRSEHRVRFKSVQFLPLSTSRVVISTDGGSSVYDFYTEKSIEILPENYGGWITCTDVNQDGTKAAHGYGNGLVRICGISNNNVPNEYINKHEGTINEVAFTGSGSHFITVSSFADIRGWTSDTGRHVGDLVEFSGPGLESIAFRASTESMLVYSRELCEYQFSSEAGLELAKSYGDIHSGGRYVSVSPRDDVVLTGSTNGTICFWNRDLDHLIGSPVKAHDNSITFVHFDRAGNLAATGSVDGTIKLWDVLTHEQVGSPLVADDQLAKTILFGDCSNIVVTVSANKVVRTWEVASGSQLTSMSDNELGQFKFIDLHPTGDWLASSSTSMFDFVRIWDVRCGCWLPNPLEGSANGFECGKFNPIGDRLIAGASDGKVLVWCVHNWTLLCTIRLDSCVWNLDVQDRCAVFWLSNGQVCVIDFD